MTSKATKTGRALERRVTDAYRQMGAKAEHDVELAGNQVDVYVELKTPGGLLHRIAVEVKDWAKPVGVDVVNGFATIVNLLRQERRIDEGVIISPNGFTKPARDAAIAYGIQLLEMDDLDAMVSPAEASERTQPTTLSSILPPSPSVILPQPAHLQAIGTISADMPGIYSLDMRETMRPRTIPFRVGRPIQDPADFVGRRDVLQCLSVAMSNLQNVSLHGERLTGKTSLLLYLAHPACSAVIGLPSSLSERKLRWLPADDVPYDLSIACSTCDRTHYIACANGLLLPLSGPFGRSNGPLFGQGAHWEAVVHLL